MRSEITAVWPVEYKGQQIQPGDLIVCLDDETRAHIEKIHRDFDQRATEAVAEFKEENTMSWLTEDEERALYEDHVAVSHGPGVLETIWSRIAAWWRG